MLLCCLLLQCACALAALDLGFEGGDSDLTSFVTRPELRAPRFNVTIHNEKAIAPGYWFVAPYIGLHQPTTPSGVYQSCQTGPHIYDAYGELVWSGACLVKNQVTSDFRLFTANGSDHLSAILYRSQEDPEGHGILMNSSFTIAQHVNVPDGIFNLDMHGLRIIDNGRTGLHVNHKTELVDVSDIASRGFDQDTGFVMNSGFREFDVHTGRTRFEWWMYDHVPLSHSPVKIKDLDGPYPAGWNPYHVNSVDKDIHGDYLISSRFTDCIYKISGKDGSIIWRLGGVASSFTLQDFNFSKQHDARFIEQNDSTTIISFFDNASANGGKATSTCSSALLVALHTGSDPMTARVIRREVRPDHQLTHMRGNVQLLPNQNTFVCWSENSLISEHSAHGALLMEAQFSSQRFVTYRANKFNFTGNPIEAPVLRAFQYGANRQSGVTVCYISWNGATEVDTWEFYSEDDLTSERILLGRKLRTGFETTFEYAGFADNIYGQAIAADGRILGRSAAEGAASSTGRATSLSAPGEAPQTDGYRTQWSSSIGMHVDQSSVRSFARWHLYVALAFFGSLVGLIFPVLAGRICAVLLLNHSQ